MDPKTVIVILALNLMAIGALLALIDRRAADTPALRGFAIGSMVFGLAYLLRLALGHRSPSLVGVSADAAMIYATLAFGTGLRELAAQPPLRARLVMGVLCAYGVVAVPATLMWNETGRFAALNLGLGLAYGALSTRALATRRLVGGALHPPLVALAVLIGLLGAATTVRGIGAAWLGAHTLFDGLPAQLFYGYSTLVTVALGPLLLWMVFVRLNERLALLATHDPLTGLLNRNGLDEVLQRHFGGRSGRALVLCQIDVDHFKRINDAHGHAAGDLVLRGVASTLAAQVRAGDFVARLGGEEFLVGCEGADAAQALALAERLRTAVAACPHRLPDGGTLSCTVSIGVSPAFTTRDEWEQALRQGDAALYAAKQRGRNRVVAAATLRPAPA